jgi:hypothetical protein
MAEWFFLRSGIFFSTLLLNLAHSPLCAAEILLLDRIRVPRHEHALRLVCYREYSRKLSLALVSLIIPRRATSS